MTQVFISYSRKDLEFVDRLANDIKATGFDVWYDLSGLEPGSRWRQEIQNAIQNSQFFLVVLSPNSIISDWVEREFLFASDQKLKIIPLLYQPCTLPMWSLNLHFIDMQGKNYATHFRDLLKALGVKNRSDEENPIAIRYIEIGDEYRKRGQASQAIESYQQALVVDPDNLKARTNIGTVHLMEQEYSQAVEAYHLALEISSEDRIALSGWCEANMALGNQARAESRIEDATRHYLEILRLDPHEPDARQSLINIYTSQAESFLAAGQEDQALSAFSEVLKYSPDDTNLASRLEKLRSGKKDRVSNELITRSDTEFSAGNWEQALALLTEALQFAPQDASIQKKISNIQLQQLQSQLEAIISKVDQAEKAQRWDAAMTGLNEYLRLKPGDKIIQKRMTDLMLSKHAAWLGAVTQRVDLALADRNWELALGALNEALQLEPDNKELIGRVERVKTDQLNAKLNAMILRADQAANAGRWQDALEVLNAGLITYPNNITLKAKLSDTLQAKRKLQHQSVLNLADAAARSGKWESALAALNQVLAEEPDNPLFLEKYNRILSLERESKLNNLRSRAKNLLKEQKFEEALAAWNETLLLAPENRQIVLAEIEAVNTAQKLEVNYSAGVQAFTARDYQKTVDLLNSVILEQPGYKDAAALLAKARKLVLTTQKKPHRAGRKVWVIGAALMILTLAMGALAVWLLKGDLPAIPSPETTGTSMSAVTTLPISSPSPAPAILMVTSLEDSGTGTLRQALLDARKGDTITFDPATFPADEPVAINLYTQLPVIDQGYLTLDASNAGVVLNGSHVGGEWISGIDVWSDHNLIKGLGIINFSGAGISLQANANFNTIGGDRAKGLGQIGEGNFVGANSDGIAIRGSDNLITGNLVGIISVAAEDWEVGNKASGIFIADNASRNTLGPDNIIAYNSTSGTGCGIDYVSLEAKDNIITTNTIYANKSETPGICYNINPGGQFVYSTPPAILYADLESGTAAGQTCPNCLVEIFSTDTRDAKIFEGGVTADEFGNFVYIKNMAFTGPYLTATTRSPGENTSEISLPTPKLSDIQIALNAAWVSKPVFETTFNTWEFGEQGPNSILQDGKLIITSVNQEHASLDLSRLNSARFVAEFELSFSGKGQEASRCIYEIYKDGEGEIIREVSLIIYSEGQVNLGHFISQDNFPDLAYTSYVEDVINKVKMVVLEEKIAVFINNQLAFAILDPDGGVAYSSQGFAAEHTIVCEFDNYKLWDLTGVFLNP